MKKINFRGISESLSEKELKNVKGGSGSYYCSSSALECNSSADCAGPGALCMDGCCVSADGEPGGGGYKAYCWHCTGSEKICRGSFDDCIDKFGDACPAGGAFYACIVLD